MTIKTGTYVLVLALESPVAVRVGALGLCRLMPGFYAYVGSAMGPGGLAARIRRHRRHEKKAHWHIDYLRPHTRLVEIWQQHSAARLEDAWARAFSQAPGVHMPVPGFGASDSKALSHLFYGDALGVLHAVRAALGSPESILVE